MLTETSVGMIFHLFHFLPQHVHLTLWAYYFEFITDKPEQMGSVDNI